MLAFGASYAVASLSCTLPVFLSVVASTFTRSNWASGVATFAAYALGMSAVLLTLTIALAVAQHSLVRRLNTLSGQVNRAAGALLVLAGGYIVYYWVFDLSTDPGKTTGAGPARFVERLSADAADWVQDRGWATVLVATGAVIAAAAVAVVARHHDTTATVSDETGADPESRTSSHSSSPRSTGRTCTSCMCARLSPTHCRCCSPTAGRARSWSSSSSSARSPTPGRTAATPRTRSTWWCRRSRASGTHRRRGTQYGTCTASPSPSPS